MDLKKGDPVPQTYKEWFRADLRHAEDWRKEAKLDYQFRDGKQYTDDELKTLEEQSRPAIVFNRVGSIVDAVSGQEISNRQEVRYIPRENSDQQATELLTSASRWFRDRADADDNDSEAFRDTLTGGMGWTETRLDYEDNPEGDLKDDRLDPFEMVWDYNARKNNLIDANRVWRVRKLPIEEARAFAEAQGIEAETDDHLNAEWAATGVFDPAQSGSSKDAVPNRLAGKRGTDGELSEVVLVHCQWIERESVWYVPLPGGKPKAHNKEEFGKFKAEWKARFGEDFTDETGKMLGVRKQKRKVRYQAFLGNVVLKVMPTACPDHFNFKCITGKRDQIDGQFYGLVRSMRDPQSWSNKLYSQILHIINSQAKGGIMAERSAFENGDQAEESWARTDRITWMNNGALSGPAAKVQPKPVAQTPPSLQYLMEVAGTAIHQVSGVNMELLGMREADQAGILEYQRRQAGLTILQPLFDNLKAYRREQGELILWYIQNDLSDGRLVRIIGKEEGEFVPLTKQASLEYDIIVDDMPSSPNQKEKNWQLITQMFPFIKDMMTPDVALALAEDSPLPSATVKKLQKLKEQAAQGPMAEMQQRMAQLEAAVLESKAALQSAQAQKATADAQATMMDAGKEDPRAEMAIKQAETQGKLALKAEETRAHIQIKQQEQAGEMAIKRQEAEFGQRLEGAQAMQSAALQAEQAGRQMDREDSVAQSNVAIKEQSAKAAAKNRAARPPAR